MYEQSFTKEDCSQIFEEVSYDIFPLVIHERDLKITCLSLPNTEVFCSPIFDEYAAEENILYYDQEIADSHHDSHEDAVSNSFIKDDCHDDQIVSFEIFKDDDQNTPCYDEEIRVPSQEFCERSDSIPLGFAILNLMKALLFKIFQKLLLFMVMINLLFKIIMKMV